MLAVTIEKSVPSWIEDDDDDGLRMGRAIEVKDIPITTEAIKASF